MVEQKVEAEPQILRFNTQGLKKSLRLQKNEISLGNKKVSFMSQNSIDASA